VVLRTIILDGHAKHSRLRAAEPITIAANATQTVSTRLTVVRRNFGYRHPYLYTLASEVVEGQKRPPTATVTPFEFAASLLTKRKVLPGMAAHEASRRGLHHDLGALGSAVNRRAHGAESCRLLKAAGVNAVCAPATIRPRPNCSSFATGLGLVVMDEAFDCGTSQRYRTATANTSMNVGARPSRYGSAATANHPSISCGASGNEIRNRSSPTVEGGQASGWDSVHDEDPTRPTTSAFNNWSDAIRNQLARSGGYSRIQLQTHALREIMKAHPNWIIFGSETASCVSSRGTTIFPRAL